MHAERSWVLMLVAAVTACAGSTPGPYFDDDRYLRFGLDPLGEAEAVVRDHRDHGQTLAARIQGEHFVALSFVDGSAQPTAVRVVTARGIALALDRRLPSAVSPEVVFKLLAQPMAATNDVDGDGFDEIFVEQRTSGDPCVLVYRVRDTGMVDEVDARARVLGQEQCAQVLADVDADGRPELMTMLVLASDKAPEAAQISVPLFASDHRFSVQGRPEALAQYCADEQAKRQPDLAAARQALDVERAYRLGLELAALTTLAGKSAVESVATFDAALSGLVLSDTQRARLSQARAHVYRGFR